MKVASEGVHESTSIREVLERSEHPGCSEGYKYRAIGVAVCLLKTRDDDDDDRKKDDDKGEDKMPDMPDDDEDDNKEPDDDSSSDDDSSDDDKKRDQDRSDERELTVGEIKMKAEVERMLRDF